MPGLPLHLLATAMLAGLVAWPASAQTDMRGSQDDTQDTSSDDLRRSDDQADDQSDDQAPSDEEIQRRKEKDERAEKMREPPPDLPRLDDTPAASRDPVSVGDRFHRNNAPQGLQAGPWKITPSVTLRTGYDDNVTTVSEDTDKIASAIFQLRGRVDISNEDGPNALTAYGEVVQTWYADASDLDHFDGSLGVGGNAQLSDYVRIRGGIGFVSAASADSASEGIVVGGAFDPYVDLSRYISVPASLGATFDTGHWFMEADGSVVYSDYDDRTTRGGVIIDQDFKNGTIADLKFRTGWRFTPGTALFAEAAYNLQRFKDKTADSDGWRAVAGAQFELSRLLTGDIFAGYAAQSFQGGEEVTGLTYGAHLTWFATELMSVNLDARRDFGAERTELLVGGSGTVPVTRDSVRLRVEYEPLRQLLVSAEAGYASDTYESQDRTDERYFAGLGVEYVFTPSIRIGLDYRYEQTTSAIAGDSSNNVIYLGITTGY